MNKFCLKTALCSAVMALCVFAAAPAAVSAMDSETARLLAMGKVLQDKFADLKVSYRVVGRKDGSTALSMTIANSSPTKTYLNMKYVFILRDAKDNILMRCPVKVPGSVNPKQTVTDVIAPLNTDYYIIAAQSSYITAQLPAVAWPSDRNELLGMSYLAMHSDKYKVKHALYPLEGSIWENGPQTDIKLAEIYDKIQVSAFNRASYEGNSVSLGGQFANAASLSAYCLAPVQKVNMTHVLQRSKLALPKSVTDAILDKMRDLWPEVNRQAQERLKDLAIKARIDSGMRKMKLTFTLTNNFNGVLKYADVSYWISHPGMLGLYDKMLLRYALNIAPKQTKSFDIDIDYNAIKGEKSVSKDYIKENAETKVTLYNLVINEGGKDVLFTPNLDTFIRMNAEIAQ